MPAPVGAVPEEVTSEPHAEQKLLASGTGVAHFGQFIRPEGLILEKVVACQRRTGSGTITNPRRSAPKQRSVV